MRKLLQDALHNHINMKRKLLVILGPTSTGKTDLGIEMAKKFSGEIISADSRQVYKYLDIGTGKEASIKYQVLRSKGFWIINGIKIWMYDILLPAEKFNLYEYVLKSQEIINNIVKNGKLPILAGGTGLYIRSLIEGISDFGTGENKNLRSEFKNLDIGEVRKRINKLSPEILKKLNNSELNNKRRLIRIIEKMTNPNTGKYYPGIQKDFDILKIGLKTGRKILRERIKIRVLSRIDQGMIKESEKLLNEGIITHKRMEELGLEYKYIGKYLRGEINTQDELIDILTLKIGQFAKRQETWFKKDSDVNWFDVTAANFGKKVEKKVSDWYNTN